MKRCNFCKVNILDNAQSCPLCGGVLEGTASEFSPYPNVVKKTKVVKLLFKVFLFLAIVSCTVCVEINHNTTPSIKWSYIVVGAFLYTLLFLFLFVKEGTGYRMRTFIGTLGGILFLVLIDYVFGFNKWSLNYMLPIAILAIDLSFALLMIVNKRNWQSYILLMGFMVLCSIIPIILFIAGIITKPIFPQITFLITLFLFLGVLIFGGPRVWHELKRRFYIK